MGIIFNNPDFTRAICHRAQAIVNIEFDVSFASVANGKLLGGVVFTAWTGRGGSVGGHVASWHPRWLTRDLLFVSFDYAFNGLAVKKVFGTVPSDNMKAISLNRRWGYKEEARVSGVYPGADMVLMSLVREDCRYLGLKSRFRATEDA